METLVVFFADDMTVHERSRFEQMIRDELDKLDNGSYFDLETREVGEDGQPV